MQYTFLNIRGKNDFITDVDDVVAESADSQNAAFDRRSPRD